MYGAPLQQVITLPVLMHEVILSQVQDSRLSLVRPHLVPLCPALQPVQVSLNGSTAFMFIFVLSLYTRCQVYAVYLICSPTVLGAVVRLCVAE